MLTAPNQDGLELYRLRAARARATASSTIWRASLHGVRGNLGQHGLQRKPVRCQPGQARETLTKIFILGLNVVIRRRNLGIVVGVHGPSDAHSQNWPRSNGFRASLSRRTTPLRPSLRPLSVDWLWRSRGRNSLLHVAVGLGPETPCKLAAAPEAIPLSPRLFPGRLLRNGSPLP